LKQDISSIEPLTPTVCAGGWINYLIAVMIWENRDSEFDPHRGNRAELELRMAPELISSYGMASARLELRQYFYLFNWLTIANRLETRHAAGDVPYWELSAIGGENSLRGYPLNRFLGNSSIAYTLEVRGWFLKFPELENLKFGGHLFTDAGRVFTGSDDLDDLFNGYKQTVGFGGAMSVFHPDLILRGEIGFSEEVSRIYIGVGYLF
jgi:outer membrane protein assembly factor BamA